MKLKKASIDDKLELQKICTRSYTEVFANHWTGNGLELYLEQQFGDSRLNLELVNPDYEYFFIKKDDENIGFVKMNYKTSEELSELDNCELDKIYILPKYSGMGIGKMAMSKIIEIIKQKGKMLFFLCVIDENKSAIAFYEKLGFEFHSKTRLDVPNFREELRGMNRMCLRLGHFSTKSNRT